MSKFLKLFKHNMSQYKVIFISMTVLNVIISSILCVIICFDMNKKFDNIINTTSRDSFYGDYIFPSVTLVGITVLVMIIMCLIFISLTVINRISNGDNTMFVLLQLPVKREDHVYTLLIETILFTIIQYIIGFILMLVIYKYLVNLQDLAKSYVNIDTIDSFGIFIERISSYGSFFMMNYPLYRVFITIPTACILVTLIIFVIYKYRLRAIAGIIGIFLLSILKIDFMGNFISNIFDDFSTGNMINSIILLIICLISSVYIFNKKLDF